MAAEIARWVNGVFSSSLALTEDDFRAWAYDDELDLCEQDEDLVIGISEEFYPVLLKLAFVEKCPKQSYIKQSIDHHIVFSVLHGQDPTVAVKLIDYVLNLLLPHTDADAWKLRLIKLKELAVTPPHPLTEVAAIQIAQFVMGPHIPDDAKIEVRLSDPYRISVWRGFKPSWGISFERETGRMMRDSVY